MSGWTKVILATAVMILAIAAVNLSIWRRLRVLRDQQQIEPPREE